MSMATVVPEAIKNRIWFYEFELPDGSRTNTDVPVEVRLIHTSRRDKLRAVIEKMVGPQERASAIDFASHEGYFSIELAKHFRNVLGIEVRKASLEAARQIAATLGVENITFRLGDLQTMPLDVGIPAAHFVLVYGLLYHLENPIHVLRLAARLCTNHILVETQVTTFDVSGKIEDGYYLWQRDIGGTFVLAADYCNSREGGSTDFALIPSLSALIFLLKGLGFCHVEVLLPDRGDYEQFMRQSRVLVYGRKQN
jgi:hypothetical protein